MKLYATVTSERASKGQGGEWLDIDIFTTNRDEPTHRVIVRETTGRIDIKLQHFYFGEWRNLPIASDVIYTNAPKGEQ